MQVNLVQKREGIGNDGDQLSRQPSIVAHCAAAENRAQAASMVAAHASNAVRIDSVLDALS
jgi:hypothetical protein